MTPEFAQGLLVAPFGLVMVIFHRPLGRLSLNFRNEVMREDHPEDGGRGVGVLFLIFGVVFAAFGALIMFGMLRPRS